MSEPYLWVEVTTDTIRGDRDGLVSLRDALNDALRDGGSTAYLEDRQGTMADIRIERVGP